MECHFVGFMQDGILANWIIKGKCLECFFQLVESMNFSTYLLVDVMMIFNYMNL